MRQQFDSCNTSVINTSLPLINSSTYLNLNTFICLNSSLRQTNSREVPSLFYEFAPIQGSAKYICYVVFGLVLFFGIFGNIIVFYVVGYEKKKRNSGDIYTLSLACSDILASMVVPMIFINDLITDHAEWLYGKAVCYILPPFSQLTLCASGWSLVFISLDRYRYHRFLFIQVT